MAYTSNSMYFHTTELSTMTAAWLLPIVAPIVAAASGGIVAGVLPNPQHALWTIIVSYVLWGTGIPLAMAVLVIYFHRLTVHKLPPREVIVSVFLPLGPLGQGGFGIMQLGKVALQTFPKTHTLQAAGAGAGDILYVVGWLMALIMWGFGIVWLFFALASISRSKFPFNMGWWGFTFPLGVFAISTSTLGKETPSTFFSILGTVRTRSFSWLIIKADYGLDFLPHCHHALDHGSLRNCEKACRRGTAICPMSQRLRGQESAGSKAFRRKYYEGCIGKFTIFASASWDRCCVRLIAASGRSSCAFIGKKY